VPNRGVVERVIRRRVADRHVAERVTVIDRRFDRQVFDRQVIDHLPESLRYMRKSHTRALARAVPPHKFAGRLGHRHGFA